MMSDDGDMCPDGYGVYDIVSGRKDIMSDKAMIPIDVKVEKDFFSKNAINQIEVQCSCEGEIILENEIQIFNLDSSYEKDDSIVIDMGIIYNSLKVTKNGIMYFNIKAYNEKG